MRSRFTPYIGACLIPGRTLASIKLTGCMSMVPGTMIMQMRAKDIFSHKDKYEPSIQDG